MVFDEYGVSDIQMIRALVQIPRWGCAFEIFCHGDDANGMVHKKDSQSSDHTITLAFSDLNLI